MNNIRELNELIYAGANLVCAKISALQEKTKETQNLNFKLDRWHTWELYDKQKCYDIQ